MVDSDFIKLQNKLEPLIKSFGSNYNYLLLEGKKNDGSAIKRIIVEVNGQNFLQIDSDLFITFQDFFPRTKFQKSKYYCSPGKDGLYNLRKYGKEIISKKDFSHEALIKEVFGEIEVKLQNRQRLVELLEALMGRCILFCDLGYDANEQSYHFLDWNQPYGTEYMWFSNYFRSLKSPNKSIELDNHYVAKYTSLETALMILNSGKMRMMSVTAMNDRMEIGHLYGELCNEDSAYLENKTKIHNARQRYITSFTNKIDDLTMWRLYGDNGKGVCLIFSIPHDCNYYFPIDYSGINSEIYLKAKKICEELDKHGFKFTFKSIEAIWQYFLKPKGFSDEQEFRYLRIDNSKPDGYSLASNGIISCYKDLLLIGDKDKPETEFPVYLGGIILGPNMRNVEINKFQLEALAAEKGLPLLRGVQCSSINYYI